LVLREFRFVSNLERKGRIGEMGNRKKRYLLTIVIILIFFFVGGYFLYPLIVGKESNQKYRTVKVERGEISSLVTATGTINPVVTVLVGSQISGTIKGLYADFNSRVKEGEVIAQIDPAILEAQVEQAKANVLGAQSNLMNSRANLQSVQANLVKAEVAVEDTKKTLNRNNELMKMSAIAQSALDTAQANYDSAVAQRNAVKAQIEVAKAQIESAGAQVERDKAALRMSETNLRYTTIRSPVNGIVISRNVDVGQTVAASLQAPTLFTIAKDLTQMQVDTNMSEADIGRIVTGQEATFTVDAYPEKTFRGRVSVIRNAPTTIQNVVTYDVVIQVDNKDLKLKPGMTANVSVIIAHKTGVLKLSNAALRYRPELAKATVGEGVGNKNKNENENKSKNKNEGSQKREATAERGTGGQQRGGTTMEQLTEGLKLSPEQRSKVEAVLRSSRQEIQEIRENSKPEEARGKIQSLLRQKIMGLLTEEQKQKWEASRSTKVEQGEQVEERKPARVWVLSSEGKPVSVSIVLGITDGTFSEVVSGDLKEGAELIVEETSKQKNQAANSSRLPFMPGPRR
jgi:HlyD family secretion protein